MLEVSNPSNVLNISGEFQREMPIQARRNWSDFLEITPGVHSRPFDDGSGRMVYFGHSTEHFAHVVQLEGAIASNYQDAQITYVAMGADMVARHAGEDRRRRRVRADGRRPQYQRHHQERRQHVQGVGRLRVSAERLERQQRRQLFAERLLQACDVERRRHADDGHHPAVRRRRRRTDPTRQGLVLRLGPAGRPRSRHQPDSRGSPTPQGFLSERRALQQHHGEHAAVRESDHAGGRAPGCGVRPAGSVEGDRRP